MLLDDCRRELLAAGRLLRRAPAFTAAAALTLAVGVGGATAMFALVHGVLWRPLPVHDQDRLFVAWTEDPARGFAHWPFRSREVERIRRHSRLLEGVAAASYYGTGSVVAVENGVVSELRSASVAGGFFEVLGVAPLLGRALGREDDVIGGENSLVISGALWRRRYGGSPDAVGRRLRVGGQPFTIVGVMPADLCYPRGVEAWTTLAADASTQPNPAFREGVLRDVDLVARLRRGVTLEQARGELQALVAGFEAEASADSPRGLRVVARPYAEVVVGDVRPAMLALFAAVGLVLLVASANVATLLLLRGEGRRRELAVRAALGARRRTLARQLFAEGLLPALPAALVGLVCCRWLLAAVALVPGGLPRQAAVRIDAPVVLFAFVAALAAAVLAGLAPLVFAARVDLAAPLRGGGGRGLAAPENRGRRALVVAQLALALTIVAAANLLTRSLLRLQAVEMGLAADRLVFVFIAPVAGAGHEAGRPLPQLAEALVAELESAPGIEAATPVNTPPFAGTGGWDLPVFTAEGQGLAEAGRNPALNVESVHPGYFSTFQVPLLRGRTFTRQDREGAPEVAIVSADLAERLWGGQDPLGRRLKFGRPDSTDAWRTVVGVVEPTRYRELSQTRPTLYLPAPQFVMSLPIVVLRTSLPPASVVGLVRPRIAAVDPRLAVTRVAPFGELLAGPLARPRFNAFLILLFGVVALLLAAMGLYAVVAASVRQRDAEIAIRVALGATPAEVRRLALSESLRLAGVGTVIGLAIAAAGARLLRGLLFEVQPLDPTALAGAAVALLGVAALASWLPARRAARLDPAAVLRAE